MHPRSPPNSSWLLSYCLLSAWWRALLGPCRRSRWSFSVHLKVNNSATKTSLAMISDAYESPSHRLSHAVPLVSRFKVKYVPVQIFPPFMKTSKLPAHSTLYNSATRTRLAMILDSYESPTSGLSYAVPYVRRLGKKYISVQFFPPVQYFPLLGSEQKLRSRLREHRQGRGTACTGQVSCLTKRRLAAYSAQDVCRSVHSDCFTCASMVLRIRCVASRTCAWPCTPLAGPKTSFHACSKHERMRDRHHGDMCAPRF